jgi:hypothetical protein
LANTKNMPIPIPTKVTHAAEFRLTRGALDQLAAEQAEADSRAGAAEAENEADCKQGRTVDLGQQMSVFH